MAYEHLNGHRCPKCSGKVFIPFEEFIERARKIHGDKYDYSLARYDYKNSNTKVRIICPKHGIFEISPSSHINAQCGCPRCSRRLVTTEDFIERAREVHGDKYDYSLSEYTGNNNKLIIICPKHGPFEQIPHNHLRGHGCSRCRSLQSKILLTVLNALEENNISYSVEKIFDWLKDKSYLKLDVYLPDYNIAIEC